MVLPTCIIFESSNANKMNITTKDGITYQIEVICDSVIAYNTDRDYLKDIELVFDGLFLKLKNESIEEVKTHLYDDDFLWSDTEVRAMAWERLPEALKDEYEKGNYTHRHN